MRILKARVWLPWRKEVTELELGGKYDHTSSRVIQNMELDATGGLLVLFAGGDAAFLREVPIELLLRPLTDEEKKQMSSANNSDTETSSEE